MHRLPPRARAYVVSVWLLGLLAAAGAGLSPHPNAQCETWEIGLLILLGALAGRAKVRLMPRSAPEDIGSLSLGFALIFATLLRCGPTAAMLVGALTTLCSCLFPKRQPTHQILFNLSMNACGTWTVGQVFLALNGGTLVLEEFRTFVAVMGASLAFFLVNTGTVAGAIALSTGQSLVRLWTGTFLWTAPSYFASAGVGLIVIIVLGAHVALILLCLTPVAYLTYLSYALYTRRAEEEGQRIQELQAHETQLTTALQREHRIAEAFQRSLLATSPQDAMPGLTVATQYEPAWDEALIGGDFYDAVALANGRVALVVGDVTGKGLGAAIHTAEVKFALRAFLHEHPNPSQALQRLNDFLADAPPGTDEQQRQPLVSVAVAVLDSRTGLASVGAAGAENPLLLRAGGEAETVPAGGMPLGALPGTKYESSEIRLASGDTLLMATDGITEARAGRQFFGYEGLVRSAQKARACDSEEQMGRAIVAEAKHFAGGALHDDVCLLLARRH